MLHRDRQVSLRSPRSASQHEQHAAHITRATVALIRGPSAGINHEATTAVDAVASQSRPRYVKIGKIQEKEMPLGGVHDSLGIHRHSIVSCYDSRVSCGEELAGFERRHVNSAAHQLWRH